jgi:hypothetical protein
MTQNRLYNLIEHLAGDQYLTMDELEGPLSIQSKDLAPDSPEWFAWLATLPSFHFRGKQGHFTARHEETKKRAKDAPILQYWYAYRKAYGKQHKRYLGATSALTLAKLEQTAQDLHTAVLGSLPEDEILNQQVHHKPDLQGLILGPLTFLWHDEILKVQSSVGTQYLTQRQTAELLVYLYEHRTSILRTKK